MNPEPHPPQMPTTDGTETGLSRHPLALRVRKRPIPVQVEFAQVSMTVTTLEGPVPADAGDAIITGISGERWPVPRARFHDKYAPVPPLQAGQPGSYLAKPKVVLALQMALEFSVTTSKGATLTGKPGDWMLDYGDGSNGVVAQDIFSGTYEAA